MKFQVATANSVEFSAILPYAFDDNWFFEQKVDGVRLAVIVERGVVSGVNRKGNATPVDPRIEKALRGSSGTWVFDGEWVDETFWVFDLPIAPAWSEGRAPYGARRLSLDALAPALTEYAPNIRLLPVHRTPAEKVALARWVVEHNAEGLVLKDRNATYVGKRSDAMLKAKLVETVDCIVLVVGREGKRSVAVGLYDEERRLVDVGSVAVTDEMLATLVPGQVIEVAYLYTSADRRLYQPRFRSVRLDKAPVECTTAQLKYTSKTVLATSAITQT